MAVQRNGKTKRTISWAALLLAVVMLLTACSGGGSKSAGNEGASGNAASNDTADTGGASGGSSGDPVTITFWFPWGGDFQKEFAETVVKPFEAANPDIKVKMTFVENTGNTQASDKLLTAIAGGKAPDVALFDRFMVGQWADKGSLEDITEYVERDDMAGIYYPSVWSEAQYEGRTYALPWNTDNRGMYYNKNLMKEAGLDPEKPPVTMAELDAMAEKMFKKNGSGKYDQVGFIPWMGQGFLYTQGWNFGGQWEKDGELTPNDPQIVKALEWMQGYAKKYDAKTLTSFSDAMGQTGQNPFLSGKVGFIFDGNWLLNDIDKYKANFEWGVAPMPYGGGDGPFTWAGGWSYVMPKGAKNKDQAWKFMKFVAGKEGTLLWAKRPTGKFDLTCIPEVNSQLGLDTKENMEVFVGLMDKAFIRPVSPVGGFMWNEMFRVQDLAINLKGEPQALLDEVKKNVDAELAKVKAE